MPKGHPNKRLATIDPHGLRNTIQATQDARARNQYAPRSAGRRYGMGVCQFWAYLFELNESLPKKKKMTDEEIKRQMLLEFPDRPAVLKLGEVGKRGQVTVNHYRQLYNMGRLTSDVVPEVRSIRYSLKGLPVNPRTGKPYPKGSDVLGG